MPSFKSASPIFRAGESIPESGLYRVLHGGHRGTHEAVLLRAQVFPRCQVCGANVHFELLQAAPHLSNDKNFRDRKLFELPHPERAKRSKLPRPLGTCSNEAEKITRRMDVR